MLLHLIVFNSSVVEVTPSKMFISVAVAVTATSSFIFGLVNVLLVSVCENISNTCNCICVAGKVNVMFPENLQSVQELVILHSVHLMIHNKSLHKIEFLSF